MRFAAAWHRFWFTPRRAEDLAICRVLFAAGMFLVGLSRPIHEWGEVPAFYHRPAFFLRRLGIPILDTGVLQGMEFIWLAAMVTLALGWYSRTSAAIVCLGSLYLFGIDAPDVLGRSLTAGVFVPAILAVSYCGDVLSVDAWRRRRRGQVINRPAEEYGWPARLVCAFLSYVFFAAGVAKIRETGFPEWMLSDQTTRSLLLGHYWYASRNRALWPVGAQLLQIHAGAGVALAVITQFAELLYPLALFVRAARWTVVPVMLAILIGIAVNMGPFFHLTILAHVFWVPWSSVGRRRVGERVPPRVESSFRGGQMRSMAAAKRLTGASAFLLALGWAGQAHAQLGVGTTWLRTDPQGKGIVLSVEACCNGGLRLVWQIPPMGGQPASTMTVDSPMNGTEVPVLIAGKPSGETMAIRRVDDHHYSAIVKMKGQPFGTSNGTVSVDNRTMTVDSAFGVGSQAQKTTETWVRK